MSKQPENFGQGPVVDPAVLDPAARSYAKSIQDRRRPGAYSTPVGGAPMPAIPRLDQPHQEGRTMAAQAPMPQPQMGGRSIIESGPGGGTPASILPADLLPDGAAADPLFRQGQGAMYASSQPALALKYGVIRNGKHIPPQMLNPNRRRSAEDSVADVTRFLEAQRGAELGDGGAEQAATQGPAGAAARIANPPGVEGVQPLTAEEKEKLKRTEKAIENLDEFDFNALRQAMMKDLLNNDEQRAIIEERLEPLDLTALITRNVVTQTVPIVPGIFEPVFQSMGGQEDLALKRLIMSENNSLEQASNRYLLDKFSLMSVACGTYAINKQLLPPHLDTQGNFNDDLFWTKFNRVVKFPFHMLASLGVNYFWFDVRVRKLFVAEKIKNG